MNYLHEKGTNVNRQERSPGASGTGTGLFATLSVFVLAVVVSLVFCAAAFAETHRGFTGHLGEKGTGVGQLEEPQGVAVNDTTGDVYVVDRGNDRIDEFEADGTFVRAWGWGVVEGIGKKEELQTCTILTGCGPGVAGSHEGQLDSPEAIAVDNYGSASDPSKEDVYVTDTADRVVEKFSATGEFKGQITEGAGGAPFDGLLGVAVDPAGTLWVYVGTLQGSETGEDGEIDGYSDALVNVFESTRKSGAAGFVEPGLAVGSTGDFYVGHRESRYIAKLEHSGSVIAEEVGGKEGATAVAVDASDDAYINIGSLVQELSGAGTLLETFGQLHPVSGAGIAVGSSSGPVYVGDTAENTVDVFTLGSTPEEAPKTEPVGEVTATTAMFHGELNPGGKTGKLEYQFDYNTGSSCTGGQSVPAPKGEVANASKAVVQAKTTGLQPSAQYTVCLVALNPFGSLRGNEVPFTTKPAPPEILGESTALPVKAIEATLEAKINPNNQETTYSFEYATSEAAIGTAGATKVPSAPGTLPAVFNSEGEPVSAATEPLTQGTTYFYRVVAENEQSKKEGKPVKGKVEHFTAAIPPATPEGKPANPVAAFAATLNGVLNPNNVGNAGTYEFVYKQSASECELSEAEREQAKKEEEEGKEPVAKQRRAPEPPGTATGATPEAVHAEVTGLLPHTSYTFCLRARNEAGEESAVSAPVTFITLASHPTIGETFTTNAAVTSATVNTQIDPQGAPTTYHVEYDTAPYAEGEEPHGTSVPIPNANAGSGPVSIARTVLIQGLAPGTVYHCRVVATNALGTTDGPDVTFATYASVAGLPDGRVYEPVSPVGSSEGVDIYIPEANYELTGFNEHGVNASELLPFQAAADGEAVAYAGDPPPTGGTADQGKGGGNEYLSMRLPGGGWTQVALETGSQNETESNGEHDQYRAFTSDLSVGFLEGPDVPVLGFPLGYNRLYAHAIAGGVDGEYESLLTTVPDRSPTELSTVVGSASTAVAEQAPYAGANSGTAVIRAYSHLLFESNADLLEGEGQLEQEVREDVKKEIEAGKHSAFAHYLYDHVGGKLYLVDVLPNGKVAPGAAFGSIQGVVPANGLAGGGPDFTHVISADGSRVFWTYAPGASPELGPDGERNPGPVFHRSQALYVRENDTRPQSPVGPEDECLVAADACTVQVDAAVGGEGIFQGASADGSKVFFTKGDLYEYDLESGETIDLSPGVTVKGVAGISENGEYVYYVDADNDIVLWHAGVTTRVATEGATSNDYSSLSGVATDYAGEIGSRTAEVTPDGHSLVFMSNTGVEQVFLYEAQSGKLTCVSCDPTGEAPVHTNASTEFVSSVGAVLPVSFQPTYQPRWITEDGSRVFFESAQPLVPQATNGWLDVYEWERDGTGSCQLSRGCIFLLSSGSDPENSYLLDASANGNDVFIITRAQLVPQDRGDLDNVYDVRVGGVRPPAAAACSGTGCQGVPPPPPIFATPASVTFNGTGNFPPPAPTGPAKKVTKKTVKCKKGETKNKKGKCTKKKKPKKSAAKKSTHRKGSR